MFLDVSNIQRKFLRKSFLIIILSSIGILVSMIFVFSNTDQVQAYDNGIPKALILDQLYNDFPDEYFQNTAKKYLEASGYEVDIVTTEDITVEYMKNLPTMNYKFVVVRSHGVADDFNQNEVALFTGEKYTEDSYILEQLSGTIKKGAPLIDLTFMPTNQESTEWVKTNENQFEQTSKVKTIDNSDDEYFLISPKFVRDVMKGSFSNTIFFLGGCETMAEPSMAKSLVDKGASLVVGWDRPVGSVDNDQIMLEFLKNFLVEKYDVKRAIDLSQFIPIEYMKYPSQLQFYTNS